ncbi:MAG: hypothetical protein HYX28_09240 [Candidatus Koribacter versatilis]|uniref:STAS/SEC14 domain-containing protein n=1 Tax=Candidatus Korobacter versatilis TaxID=658062 RepID=A0A932A943_9BACT|nr:hypothetical protein [Candidatus Koribacter versatilis]
MERVRFITHKGKQVLLLDYHGLADEAETLAMIEERKRIVTSQPKGSVLTVANVAGARLSKDALTKIKEANVYDLPYVRRAALVGVDERQEKKVEAVETFSHHHHERFATMEEALDWVVREEK